MTGNRYAGTIYRHSWRRKVRPVVVVGAGYLMLITVGGMLMMAALGLGIAVVLVAQSNNWNMQVPLWKPKSVSTSQTPPAPTPAAVPSR